MNINNNNNSFIFSGAANNSVLNSEIVPRTRESLSLLPVPIMNSNPASLTGKRSYTQMQIHSVSDETNRRSIVDLKNEVDRLTYSRSTKLNGLRNLDRTTDEFYALNEEIISITNEILTIEHITKEIDYQEQIDQLMVENQNLASKMKSDNHEFTKSHLASVKTIDTLRTHLTYSNNKVNSAENTIERLKESIDKRNEMLINIGTRLMHTSVAALDSNHGITFEIDLINGDLFEPIVNEINLKFPSLNINPYKKIITSEWPFSEYLKDEEIESLVDLIVDAGDRVEILELPSLLDDDIDSIIDACPNIENLKLKGLFESSIFKKIAKGLKNLVKLDAGNIAICNNEAIDDLILDLRHAKKLKTLNLSHTTLTNRGISSLIHIENLEKLNLSHTLLTDDGIPILKLMNNLRKLDISNNLSVTDRYMENLSFHENLQEINITNTQVTKKGKTYLCNGDISVTYVCEDATRVY